MADDAQAVVVSTDGTTTDGTTTDDTSGIDTTQAANGTDSGESVCSSCGMPLHILRSGPTGEVRDDGVVWLTVLGCQNQSDHGGVKPCVLFGQDQQRVENVVPTVS